MTPPLYVQAFGLFMFGAVFLLLMVGFPVGFTMAGTGFAFALLGAALGLFDFRLLSALPLRLVGLMENDLLQAVPVFLYLGVVLQRTTLAADLLEDMSGLFGKRAGGLGISTIIIGALLAPTTGAVGATVLTIGVLALPSMLDAGYDKRLASGIVCAAGTLGTILPPSIILILLGDLTRGASVEAQLARGVPVTPLIITDLYLGALIPVGLLLCLYLVYVALVATVAPGKSPPLPNVLARRPSPLRLVVTLILPVTLIVAMLALIITGFAYTVEAAAAGAVGATLFALLRGELNLKRLDETVTTVIKLTAMVFMLLIGASTFTLVFRGFSGDLFVTKLLAGVPGGPAGAVAAVMAVIFVLGFFLDSLEIIFLVVPIAMPPLLFLDIDPIWLAVLTAVNLQTSFLVPPFGFALFFLRGVAPRAVKTTDIYRGVLPFIAIQLLALALLWWSPAIATGLPRWMNALPVLPPSTPQDDPIVGEPYTDDQPIIIPLPDRRPSAPPDPPPR